MIVGSHRGKGGGKGNYCVYYGCGWLDVGGVGDVFGGMCVCMCAFGVRWDGTS